MSDSVLAHNLSYLMKKNKVTISELSEATGVAEITINKLRNGQSQNPTISTLLAIANFFKIAINDLLFDTIKNLTVLNEDNVELLEEINIHKIIGNTDFAIKITHNNYPMFQKDTILLVNKKIEVKNGDYIVINSNKSYIICKSIIEPGMILGESLSRKENVYTIDSNDLFGVVIGALWSRN